jgi:hypothetical protein
MPNFNSDYGFLDAPRRPRKLAPTSKPKWPGCGSGSGKHAPGRKPDSMRGDAMATRAGPGRDSPRPGPNSELGPSASRQRRGGLVDTGDSTRPYQRGRQHLI